MSSASLSDTAGSELAVGASGTAAADFSAFSFAFLSAFSLRFNSLSPNYNKNLKIYISSKKQLH